jgi:type I restriction enzyme S subunit
MISDLKPYPEYKESGLPWVGKVPAHWDMTPNRGLIRKRKVLVGEHHAEYRLLSLTKQGVIIRDISTGKGKFSSDMGTSQEVRAGDLVFCLFDVPETPRTVGLSNHDGMITGAYSVFESKKKGDFRYFESFYLAMDDRKLLSPLYSGLRNTIPTERLMGAKTPQPSEAEQIAIVRFLAWSNGRLNQAIRAKNKVIALLSEQKRTIIQRAVTCGLEQSASVKPSGIPWLGSVPSHWEVRPLKQILKRIDYGTSENVRAEGKIRVLTMAHIRDGRVVLPTQGGLEAIPPGLLLENHDLLFNRTNSPDLVGKVGLFTGDAYDKVTFASYLVRLRTGREHNPLWLNYLLNSSAFWGFARSQALVSLHQANLNPNRYGRMLLPIPSRRAEQDEIVEYIRARADDIELTIARLEREVELLREYRIRFVADVVTGKLDVREAAAKLPDDESQFTVQEDSDLMIDSEGADEELTV